MTNKTEPDDTFDTFLVRIKENKTTVAEMAYWYWNLLEEYEGLDKALELLEERNDSLEKGCACFKNSQITQKIKVCKNKKL